MEDSIEYQIYIGCHDIQLQGQLINGHELEKMVSGFFERRQIDFTMVSAKGGFIYEDGSYITEDTLIIDIIGPSELDIIRLAKSLSMVMNQDCSLVVRNDVKKEFR